jgi:outer membrane autotransporter protein
LGAPAPWNFWSSFRFADISDDRYERESDSVARSVDMGLDRRITDDLIIGMTFSLEDSATDSFGGSLNIQTAGFRLGPYAAYRLSPHWAIDTLLTYGHYYNDVDLSVLSGDYNSERFSGEVTLHGQYRFGAFFVRPKASVSYSYVYSDDYDLAGRILNLPVSVSVDGATANYGALDFSTEVSRNFNLPDGQPFRVFAELGAQYEFERPDDGKILSGDLTEVIPSPWEFSVRSGFRTLLNEAIQIEATGGYLSLGQEDLDVWEGKFHLSWSF